MFKIYLHYQKSGSGFLCPLVPPQWSVHYSTKDLKKEIVSVRNMSTFDDILSIGLPRSEAIVLQFRDLEVLQDQT